jgi:alpha-L-rhamnosidase
LVASLLPVAELVVRWFAPFQREDGLLDELPGWALVDWSSVYTDGVSAAEAALWARALADVRDMARWLGQDATARWCDERWQSVRAGFEACWDGVRGAYVDRPGIGPVSQHTNAAALCAGLVPSERVEAVVRVLTDRPALVRHSVCMAPDAPRSAIVKPYPPEVPWDADRLVLAAEPFFRSVVHEALRVAGRADLVADACLDWWPWVEAGETSWPETWESGTHCHGWSSTPTADLVRCTLGVTPASPGFASVRVVPALGALDWAEGAVPTPHGLVTVRATHEGEVTIDSPVPVVRD